CRIQGWPSDGISMQRGGRNTVTRCRIEKCQGHGLHAGGGMHNSVFSENVSSGNVGDGFYFCIKVHHVVVRNNEFIGNKGSGVGGLGDGGDTENTVAHNICRENGANGITLWQSIKNTVTDNICLNNSKSSPGRYSGIFLGGSAENVVSGNQCTDDQDKRTQKHGIEERADCRGNVFANNLCRGNAEAGLELSGQDRRQTGNLE
ncbi:MAG: right-handed parallel beta-helix repeat-containing protein, partial [Planctomycetes bacterium]|nr:right-handed parallel beta-helix repeat-containing protein [Planctomycetota bacterium]